MNYNIIKNNLLINKNTNLYKINTKINLCEKNIDKIQESDLNDFMKTCCIKKNNLDKAKLILEKYHSKLNINELFKYTIDENKIEFSGLILEKYHSKLNINELFKYTVHQNKIEFSKFIFNFITNLFDKSNLLIYIIKKGKYSYTDNFTEYFLKKIDLKDFLKFCIEKGHIKIVKFLLDNTQLKLKINESNLRIAIDKGFEPLVKLLLKNINFTSQNIKRISNSLGQDYPYESIKKIFDS